MVFVACGLNHKTTPLEMREQVAFVPARQQTLLHNLSRLPSVQEAALLSTCNRTEIYCHTEDPRQLGAWLAKEQALPESQLHPHLYSHQNEAAIRHILRVASGLDSMMLGEPQILGQLKQAYQQACDLGTVQSNLRGIFEYIFSASKRIRNQSGIGSNPVSIAYAAVQLIGQYLHCLPELKILLIGSGETSTLVAKYLHQEGVSQFMVSNRTQARALELAAQFSGTSVPISDIPSILHQADVVVSATACPLPFINRTLVSQAMERRQARPMFFLDLAVPRDIESNVATIDNVHLFNIDSLQNIIQAGKKERLNSAKQAEELIEVELENYVRWHRSLRADDVICRYRSAMESIANQELQRSLSKLENGQAPALILQEMNQRLMNKLLHQPTVGMRQIAEDAKLDMLPLTQYLFNSTIDKPEHEEVS